MAAALVAVVLSRAQRAARGACREQDDAVERAALDELQGDAVRRVGIF